MATGTTHPVSPSQTQTHKKYLDQLKTHTHDEFKIPSKPVPIGLTGIDM